LGGPQGWVIKIKKAGRELLFSDNARKKPLPARKIEWGPRRNADGIAGGKGALVAATFTSKCINSRGKGNETPRSMASRGL